MSLGVNLLLRLAELAARALPEHYDVEIFEAHHRDKKDAPSGTALALGEAVAARAGRSWPSRRSTRGRATPDRDPRGAIGFSVLRGGDIVGDHRLVFAGPGERVELTHLRAGPLRIRARRARRGALAVGRPRRGSTRMHDVLGL